MKINNNISAVISNKHLLRNEGYLSISMEKLSSGYKINHSGDDPSGMAISSKMRAQIRGLDTASQNSSDGMSVLETADGALNEVTDMIQRMRELSVQAANGTNSESDRKSIQDEIDQLVQEVDRVAETTEFNTKKLLDGSLDKRVYTDGISRVTLSDEVPAGKYDFTIDVMPTQATLESAVTWNELATSLGQAGEETYLNINGTGVTIQPGMNAEDIYTLVRKTAELGEAEISDFNDGAGAVEFYSISYGDEASLDIQMGQQLVDALGLVYDETRNRYDPETGTGGDTSYVTYWSGTNAVISLDKDSDFGKQATSTTLTKDSSVSASCSVDGRRIRMTDIGGFEIDFLIDEDVIAEKNAENSTQLSENKEYRKQITTLQNSNMNLQNENQKLKALSEDINTYGVSAYYSRILKTLDISESDLEDSDTPENISKVQSLIDTKVASNEAAITQNNTDIEDYQAKIQANITTMSANAKELEIEVTDIGPMNLQIGANEGQQMSVRIDSTGAEKLYLDQVDVSTQRGATRALEQLDEALSAISNTRSTIGAYTNRLEHAVNSLNQTSENMNQAISRIQDADIAVEMTEYTKYNVLQQASTSALSQANELPQTALQLLQ